MKTAITTAKPDIMYECYNEKAGQLYEWIIRNFNTKNDVFRGLSSVGIDGNNTGNNIQEKIKLLIMVERELLKNPEYSDGIICKSVSQVGSDAVNYNAAYQRYLLNMTIQKKLGLAPDVLSADFDNDNNEDDWLTAFS